MQPILLESVSPLHWIRFSKVSSLAPNYALCLYLVTTEKINMLCSSYQLKTLALRDFVPRGVAMRAFIKESVECLYKN